MILKKLFAGIGYITWFILNITAIAYAGKWFRGKVEEGFTEHFLIDLSFGMVMLFLVSILSVLGLVLIAIIFGDEHVYMRFMKAFNLPVE